MKKVLYVLLQQFAEHELPYLTQPLRSDAMAMKEHPKYENKIVAESMMCVFISFGLLWLFRAKILNSATLLQI